MYAQHSPFDRLKSFFTQPGALPRLILINVIVWLLIKAVSVVAFLFSQSGSDGQSSFNNIVLNWLAVPANLPDLISKPYTLISYMFLHTDMLHLLFNMLWLYWFGQIFLQYLNSRQLTFVYLSGGIAGAFFYILSYNIFPVFSGVLSEAVALGASASVLAIVAAISFYVPNFTLHLLLIGPVKIRYIALFTLLLDFMMIKSGNAGGHIAHLGGALWGFIFITAYKNRSIDFSALFDSNKWRRFNFFKRSNKKQPFRNVHTSNKPLTDEEFNYRRAAIQKKTDEILEKIKHSGYESLTRDEKDFLFSRSKNEK